MRYLIVLLLFTGCTPMKGEWVKQGATDDDVLRDYEQCQDENPLGYMPISGISGHVTRVRQCMLDHGWVQRDVKPGTELLK